MFREKERKSYFAGTPTLHGVGIIYFNDTVLMSFLATWRGMGVGEDETAKKSIPESILPSEARFHITWPVFRNRVKYFEVKRNAVVKNLLPLIELTRSVDFISQKIRQISLPTLSERFIKKSSKFA